MTLLPLSAAFIDRLGWVLVHSIWQFACLAMVVAIFQRATQRLSAAVRYSALLVALAAMIAIPMATWVLMPQESEVAGGGSMASNESADQTDGDSTIASTVSTVSARGSIAEPPIKAAPAARPTPITEPPAVLLNNPPDERVEHVPPAVTYPAE